MGYSGVLEQILEFVGNDIADDVGVVRRGECLDDSRVAQRVVGRDVSGNRWVWSTCQDHLQPLGWPDGEKRGDAVVMPTFGDPPVLIQSVYQQNQPFASLGTDLGRFMKELDEPRLPRRLGKK